MLSIPTEHLEYRGRQPFQSWTVVEWCGHQIEGIPVRDGDGRWRLLVIEGEAT